MNDSTREIIKAACGADGTISGEMVKVALDILSGNAIKADDHKSCRDDRILTRKEVSQILGISPNRVDYYCRQKGCLRRVTFPGSKRAIGISALSVQEMICNH